MSICVRLMRAKYDFMSDHKQYSCLLSPCVHHDVDICQRLAISHTFVLVVTFVTVMSGSNFQLYDRLRESLCVCVWGGSVFIYFWFVCLFVCFMRMYDCVHNISYRSISLSHSLTYPFNNTHSLTHSLTSLSPFSPVSPTNTVSVCDIGEETYFCM